MLDAPLLDLSVTRHATLHDLVLCLMLRYLIFLCGAGWGKVGWGGVGIITNFSFAPLLDLFVTRHATLHDLVLGTIDSCWGMMKKTYLPSWPFVLRTKERELNDLIWTYVRAWQWRWETALVGFALLKKNRHPFVKDVTVTAYDCKTWGFGEKKLAARPIFK